MVYTCIYFFFAYVKGLVEAFRIYIVIWSRILNPEYEGIKSGVREY